MKTSKERGSRDETDEGGRRGFLKNAAGMLLALAGLGAVTGTAAGDAVDDFARKAAARVARANGVHPLYYCSPPEHHSCPENFACVGGTVHCSTFACGQEYPGGIPVFQCRTRWGDTEFACTGGFDCDNFMCGANGVFNCAQPQGCNTQDYYCPRNGFACVPGAEYALLAC